MKIYISPEKNSTQTKMKFEGFPKIGSNDAKDSFETFLGVPKFCDIHNHEIGYWAVSKNINNFSVILKLAFKTVSGEPVTKNIKSKIKASLNEDVEIEIMLPETKSKPSAKIDIILKEWTRWDRLTKNYKPPKDKKDKKLVTKGISPEVAEKLKKDNSALTKFNVTSDPKLEGLREFMFSDLKIGGAALAEWYSDETDKNEELSAAFVSARNELGKWLIGEKMANVQSVISSYLSSIVEQLNKKFPKYDISEENIFINSKKISR